MKLIYLISREILSNATKYEILKWKICKGALLDFEFSQYIGFELQSKNCSKQICKNCIQYIRVMCIKFQLVRSYRFEDISVQSRHDHARLGQVYIAGPSQIDGIGIFYLILTQ